MIFYNALQRNIVTLEENKEGICDEDKCRIVGFNNSDNISVMTKEAKIQAIKVKRVGVYANGVLQKRSKNYNCPFY